MSNARDRAKEIIREAEKNLRELIVQAVTNGDYEAIGEITPSAKEISALVEKMSDEEKRSNLTHASRRVSGGYPKFFKTSDNKLVIIGWSRKGHTEYEHRAPRIILDQLVSVLLENSPRTPEPDTEVDEENYIPESVLLARAQQPSLKTIDKLLPRLKAEDGSVAPEYYGRTYLRWLRAIGLVDKHGHQGYLVTCKNDFQNEVNSYWRRLATR